MEVTIYANYGVLGHEKECTYTIAPAATAVCSEPYRVIIPDNLSPRISPLGMILVDLPDGCNPYPLGDVLVGIGDCPVIKWVDRNRKRRKIPLEYAE